MANSTNQVTQSSLVIDYLTHRQAIGYLGLLMPILVVLVDWIFATPFTIKNSISAYYHSPGGIFFAGVLFVIGFFLWSYKGFKGDDKPTTIAGACALGIAIFPTYPKVGEVIVGFGIPSDISDWPVLFSMPLTSVIHGLCALCFFLLITYICKKLFTRSGKPTNNKRYRLLGNIMFSSMVLLVVLAIVKKVWPDLEAPIDRFRPVFVVEVIAVWCFALAWLIKGRALGLYVDEPADKTQQAS